MNTCLAGIATRANVAVPDELRRRLGPVAYALTTVRMFPTFEGILLRVIVQKADATDDEWRGRALVVLIGNAFRRPAAGLGTRRSRDDGRLEVTIVEKRPLIELLEMGSIARLFDGDATAVTRLRNASLSIEELGRRTRAGHARW